MTERMLASLLLDHSARQSPAMSKALQGTGRGLGSGLPLSACTGIQTGVSDRLLQGRIAIAHTHIARMATKAISGGDVPALVVSVIAPKPKTVLRELDRIGVAGQHLHF